LETWLKPFVDVLGDRRRKRMCPVYLAGLIGPGDRKSVQPMAARAGEVGYDQLHHFVSAGLWDSAPLEAALLKEADRLVGDKDGFLVIDDTSLPKKGSHSVGVAHQYASSLGKTSNCQSLVSVTLASREVPVMVGLRLFLPEDWIVDPARMAKAGVPKVRQVALTKPEIAVEEIDRVVASGARFGCVLADAGYGSSGSFCQALSHRGLLWAVGLSRRQNVYRPDTAEVFPVAKTGRRRKYHITDQPPMSAEAMLSSEPWRKVSWRRGTKGRLRVFLQPAVSVSPTVIAIACMATAFRRCLARRSGLLARGDRQASRNTTSQICRLRPASRRLPPRSRPGGSASRRTSN